MLTQVINTKVVEQDFTYKKLELARNNARISYETLAAKCGLTRMGLHKALKKMQRGI